MSIWTIAIVAWLYVWGAVMFRTIVTAAYAVEGDQEHSLSAWSISIFWPVVFPFTCGMAARAMTREWERRTKQ